MSLLIKALNKAEEKAQAQTAKAEQVQAELEQTLQNKPKAVAVKKKPSEDVTTNNDSESALEWSLSPTGSTLVDPASVADTLPKKIESSPVLSARSSQNKSIASNVSPKSAANVFASKGMDPRNQNKTLAIVAGASLLVLLGMGLYYYQFVMQPEVVIPPKPILASSAVAPEPIKSTAAEESAQAQLADDMQNPEQDAESTFKVITPSEQIQETLPEVATKKPAKKLSANLALAEDEEIDTPLNQNEMIEEAPQVVVNRTAEKSGKRQVANAIASESASIEVTKSSPQASINPNLMSAYEAYNAGNDAEAQKLYKQVLQRDVRNVDALLGLGAIATRQGRTADANGWYGKVLEVEPRNSMAKSALLDSQLQISSALGNTQDTESRLKNLLAKQPDDANLHIALGDFYAEKNQWPSAQQAYFDAYSLNASAENAYNLAVTLDHMGKPKLALPYYQRAFEQASSNSDIDKAALEARIAAIQSR